MFRKFINQIVIIFLLSACSFTTAVPLEYQNDPSLEVIYLDSRLSPGAPIPGEICNHIPDLRIWGDNRIVYRQYQYGRRRVWTGFLDSQQVQSMLKQLKNQEFFQPHAPEPANPAGTGYVIKVNLKSGNFIHSWNGKPKLFSDLINTIDMSLLTEFLPQKALLVTNEYYSNYLSEGELPVWSTMYGFSLKEAENGRWITGDSLAFLWNTINENKYELPGFRDGNRAYAFALQINGISSLNPPFQCWGSYKKLIDP
jgi:hypothetical protein